MDQVVQAPVNRRNLVAEDRIHSRVTGRVNYGDEYSDDGFSDFTTFYGKD